MALPRDLRCAILEILPLTTTERWSNTATLREWLKSAVPSRFAHYHKYTSPYLNSHETLLKVAAWAGCVGYTNQLFLPHGLALLLAIEQGNFAVFRDALLRGQTNEFAVFAALRLYSSQPTVAARILTYLFTAHSTIDLDLLAEEVLLDHIVLTPALLQLLFRVTGTDFYHLDVADFLAGFLAMQNSSMPKYLRPKVFNYGYALAYKMVSDQKVAPRLFDIEHIVKLNLPVAIAETDAVIALTYLAYQPIKLLPSSNRRVFPAVRIVAQQREILQERAAALLPLLATRYAANADLEIFQQDLRFILTGVAPVPFGISQSMMATLGHLDHYAKVSNLWSLPVNNCGIINVVAWLQTVLNYPVIQAAMPLPELPKVLSIAAYQGCFTALTEKLFNELELPITQQLALYQKQSSLHLERFATLEDVKNSLDNTTSRSISYRNSAITDHLWPHLTYQDVRVNDNERTGIISAVVSFQHGAKTLVEILTPYHAQLLNKRGLSLPEYTDDITTRAEAFLSKL